MMKNILVVTIPFLIYITLFNYIENQKDLLLITLLMSTILFWATALIPDYQTSLIFLFTTLAFSLSTKEIIFSGFSSSAFWLVFAGMLIATAIKNVNLSLRLTSFFTRLHNPSYLKILVLVSFFAFGLAFIMPSGTARVVLLVPIGIIIAKSFSFNENSKGYTGILLTIILSTTLPAFTVLPANAPNMILSGLTYQIFDYELSYSYYLASNFLVLGLVKNVIIVALIYHFFKDTPTLVQANHTNTNLTKDEKIVLFTITLMLLFWLSDFVHGISPTIVAILGTLILANPTVNIIKTKDINSVNFSSLIFLATIISLGNILANNELTKGIFITILNQIEFSNNLFLNYMVLNTYMGLSGIFLTQATIPVLFTPMIDQISLLSSFNHYELFMMQVTAFSTVIFPYQMPPLVIGLALADIKPIQMIKILSIISIITIIVLFPLQYLWIGLIPKSSFLF